MTDKKLEKYSLISNDWIDDMIKVSTENRDNFGNGTTDWFAYNSRVWLLKLIKKEQLISTKNLKLKQPKQ